MLIGEYKHKIDDKNRISLPSKFRKELGKKVIISAGLDNCLSVYPTQQWKKIAETVSSLGIGQSSTRALNRFFLSSAHEVSIDSNGRVLLPETLKNYAEIEDTKAVFTGVHTHVELWDENKWNAYKKKASSDASKNAQDLGELGVL